MNRASTRTDAVRASHQSVTAMKPATVSLSLPASRIHDVLDIGTVRPGRRGSVPRPLDHPLMRPPFAFRCCGEGLGIGPAMRDASRVPFGPQLFVVRISLPPMATMYRCCVCRGASPRARCQAALRPRSALLRTTRRMRFCPGNRNLTLTFAPSRFALRSLLCRDEGLKLSPDRPSSRTATSSPSALLVAPYARDARPAWRRR